MPYCFCGCKTPRKSLLPAKRDGWLPVVCQSRNSHGWLPVVCQPRNSHGWLPVVCQLRNSHGWLPVVCQLRNSHGWLPVVCQLRNSHGWLPVVCQLRNSHGWLPVVCQSRNSHGWLPVVCQPRNSHGWLPVVCQLRNSHGWLPVVCWLQLRSVSQSRLVAGSVSATEQSRLVAGSSVLGRRCGGCGVGLDAGSVRRVQRLAMSLRVQLPPPAARRHAPAPTQDVGRLPDVDPQVRAQRQVAGLAAPEEEEGLSEQAAPLAHDRAITLAVHQHGVAVRVTVLDVHGAEGGEG